MPHTLALYSPYIPKHAGGGEKYLLSIAEQASSSFHTVLLTPASQVSALREALPIYAKTFGLDLSKVHVKASAIGSGANPLAILNETRSYSHLFAMTDGSLFPSLARQSHWIVQLPWKQPLGGSSKLKLVTWRDILVYSEFVKEVLDASWGTDKVRVLAPYVDTDLFKPGRKEKMILNVGRFFRHTTSNSKRQDVVIEAFKRLVDDGTLHGFTLTLAGNVDPNEDSVLYMEELKTLAHGYKVEFATNVSFDELRTLNAKASMYWHAAGFEVNQTEHPENTEHFGITTLEAMASGCIPFVVPHGGQKEIVHDERFFYTTEEELCTKVRSVLSKPSEMPALRTWARERSETYSKSRFTQQLDTLIHTI